MRSLLTRQSKILILKGEVLTEEVKEEIGCLTVLNNEAYVEL